MTRPPFAGAPAANKILPTDSDIAMTVPTKSILAGAALLPLAQNARAQGPADSAWGPGWGWNHMMFGGGWSMFLFWGVIIVLIIAGLRLWVFPSEKRGRTPLEILEERFARGEIDEAEFAAKRQELVRRDR